MTKIYLVTLSLLIVSSSYATNYYLSNAGSDSNSGTSASDPWQTISQLNSVLLQPGDSVFFEAGNIFRGEIIVASGGNDTAKIYFGKYGTGNFPVVSGAEVISGWSNYGGNIYKAAFSQTPAHLFADEKQMTIARFPNNGFLIHQNGIDTNNGFIDTSLTQPNGYWNGATVTVRTNDRVWEVRTVSSFSNDSVLLSSGTAAPPQSGSGYYFRNLFDLVDTANEWFYNPSNQELYFIAPGNADPSSLHTEVSVYDYGMLIQNGSSNIVIESIQFEKQRISGIFAEAFSSGITISSSVFRMPGENGIRIPNGSSHCTIANNSFVDINGISISLSYSSNVSITQNLMKRVGLIPGYGFTLSPNNMMGIDCTGADSMTISQNNLDSIGNVGIYTGMTNSLISKNILNHCLMNVNFYGSLHLIPESKCIVEDNIILNTIGNTRTVPSYFLLNVAGIFFESASSQVIEHNTIAFAEVGILLNGGSSNNSLHGNLIYNCTESQLKINEGGVQGSTSNNEVIGNTFYALSETSDVVELSSTFNVFNPAQFDSNYYFNPYAYHVVKTRLSPYEYAHPLYYTLQQWKERMNEDMNSYGSFFYRNRFIVIDTVGTNLIENSFFTNNFDGWLNFHPDTMAMFLDNSTPLDFGCLKSNFIVSLPDEVYGPSYASFQFDSGALYQLHLSTYSIKAGNVIIESKEFASSTGVFTMTPRAFPFDESRNDYNAVIQADNNCEVCYLTLDMSGQDSIVWVDNITLYPISGLYEEPEKKSRLFLNPFDYDMTFDLGDSIFFNLDQIPISGSFTLGAYSSAVLIFDSSMILSVHENVTQALLKMFPNPVLRGSTITLFIPQLGDDYEVSICDLEGKRVFHKMVFAPQKNFQIKIPSFISPGTYFISAKNKYGVWSGKVVVQ